MINAAQKGAFIKRSRDAATKLIEAKEELNNCLAQMTAEATEYNALTDEDFIGEDSGLRLKLADLWTGVNTLNTALPSNVMVIFYAVQTTRT
jgi:hypothetical protein